MTINLYLATDGNDLDDGESAIDAVATMQKAIDLAQVKINLDTDDVIINVATGTYNDTSGSGNDTVWGKFAGNYKADIGNARRTTIRPYNGNVTYDAAGNVGAGLIIFTDDVTVENNGFAFTLQNLGDPEDQTPGFTSGIGIMITATSGTLDRGCHNIIIDGITILNVMDNAIYLRGRGDSATGRQPENCTVQYCTISGCDVGILGKEGNVSEGEGAIDAGPIDCDFVGNLIHACQQSSGSSDGIAIKYGRRCRIAENVIYDCTDDGIDIVGGASFGSYDCVVEDNTVFYAGLTDIWGGGPGDGNGIKTHTSGGGNHLIRGNTVWHTLARGLDCDQSENTDGAVWYNNTIILTGTNSILIEHPAVGAMTEAQQHFVYNNIFVQQGGGSNSIEFENWEDLESTIKNNCYETTDNPSFVDGTNFTDAPTFVSTANLDFSDNTAAITSIVPGEAGFGEVLGLMHQSGSSCLEAGEFLTTTSALGSSTAVIPVSDVYAPRKFRVGDVLRVEGAASTVGIVSLSATTIVVDTAISFASGAGIHLAKYWTEGDSAPFVGAYGETAAPSTSYIQSAAGTATLLELYTTGTSGVSSVGEAVAPPLPVGFLGRISKAEEIFVATIAACEAFRDWVGASSPAEARKSMQRMAMPRRAGQEVVSRAEIEAQLPHLIYSIEDAMLTGTAIGAFHEAYTAELLFRRAMTSAEANNVAAVMDEMQQFVGQLFDQVILLDPIGGYMANPVTQWLGVEGSGTNDPNAEPTEGHIFMSTATVRWGT